MIRADTFNFNVDPLRTEITSMQPIPILQSLFFEREQIKRYRRGQENIAGLFYGRERIRKSYRQ